MRFRCERVALNTKQCTDVIGMDPFLEALAVASSTHSLPALSSQRDKKLMLSAAKLGGGKKTRGPVTPPGFRLEARLPTY